MKIAKPLSEPRNSDLASEEDAGYPPEDQATERANLIQILEAIIITIRSHRRKFATGHA